MGRPGPEHRPGFPGETAFSQSSAAECAALAAADPEFAALAEAWAGLHPTVRRSVLAMAQPVRSAGEVA
jgi:hypothetical protein